MGVLSITRVMVFVENADENIFLSLFYGSCCLLCRFAAHDDDNTTEEEEEEGWEEDTTFVVAGVSIPTSFSSS
jgi:hypothetical protein